MRLSVFTATSALTVFLWTAPSVVHAQYFDYTPRPPDVEVDLSVLEDGRSGSPAARVPQPQQIPQPRPIESMPLPPLNLNAANADGFMPPVQAVPPRPPVLSAPLPYASPQQPSPYERQRVIERVELDNSWQRPQAPSPFNPPAVVRPPAPRVEAPRTAPAIVRPPRVLSPLDGGAPVVVTGTATEEGFELPPVNVSDVVKTPPRPIAKPVMPPPRTQTEQVMVPVRKPADLPDVTPAEITVAEVQELSPVMPEPVAAPAVVMTQPPEPPAMPAGVKKSAETVIEELYTLPAHGLDGEETAALPRMIAENVPMGIDSTAVASTNETADAAGLLIFDGNTAAIDEAMSDTLSGILGDLEKTKDSRLLIRAYATGADGTKADARRIALTRALAVRSHLMDKGLAPERVDVRAMGKDSTVSPLDRVDLVLVR